MLVAAARVLRHGERVLGAKACAGGTLRPVGRARPAACPPAVLRLRPLSMSTPLLELRAATMDPPDLAFPMIHACVASLGGRITREVTECPFPEFFFEAGSREIAALGERLRREYVMMKPESEAELRRAAEALGEGGKVEGKLTLVIHEDMWVERWTAERPAR